MIFCHIYLLNPIWPKDSIQICTETREHQISTVIKNAINSEKICGKNNLKMYEGYWFETKIWKEIQEA